MVGRTEEEGSVSPLKPKSRAGRIAADSFVRLAATIATIGGLFVLVWILWVVIQKGFAAINLDFFTMLPTPPGMTGGGLANAIIGTLSMTLLAALVAIPLGLLTGIYLVEMGRRDRFADLVRFVTNVLVGVPSIIIGVFVYALMVVPMGTFSGYAGAVALGIIMLPVIIRTTEDILHMVPDSLREAGLALGVPRWRVIVQIVFRAARSGLLTGVLLSIARVSGETAPLLFTALNSPYWVKSLKEPVSNLTVTIFNYAMSPYDDWQAKAWGASLLIMVAVLAANIIARAAIGKQRERR
jgi:phosphate transport system permease protein